MVKSLDRVTLNPAVLHRIKVGASDTPSHSIRTSTT